MRLILCLLLALVGLPAFANSNSMQTVTLYEKSPGKVNTALGDLLNRPSNLNTQTGELARLLGRQVSSAGMNAGDVRVLDKLNGPGPAGGLAVNMARTMPWSSVAKGVAKAIPIVGNAVAAAELLDAIRCRKGGPNQAECDAGQPQQSEQNWRYGGAAVSSLLTYGSIMDWFTDVHAKPVNGGATSTAYENKTCEQQSSGVCAVSGVGSTECRGYRCTANARLKNTLTGDTISYGSIEAYGVGSSLQVMKCPDLTVNGQVITPLPGGDGLCPTGQYSPASEEQVAQKVEAHGDKSKAEGAAGDIIKNGIPVDLGPITIGGPTNVPLGTTTSTSPGGATTTSTGEGLVTYRPETNGDPTSAGYEWVENKSSTTTTNTNGTPTTTTTTTTQAPTEFKTCGLPGTPPCKIDESGTPQPPEDDVAQKVDTAALPWKTCVTSPMTCLPQLPDLDWSFQLPAGCSGIPMGSEYGKWGIGTIDICSYQSMFHDLMSMVWAAAGLFFAVGMVFKEANAG